jgi:type II secretory pathway component PulC
MAMRKAFILSLILLFSFLFITLDGFSESTAPKYDRGRKKNPFIPIVTNDGQLINVQDEDKETKFNLEGIIYDKEGQSMAIINGQILRKNDSILDAKIVEVRKDGVVYVKDGEIFILNAKKEE